MKQLYLFFSLIFVFGSLGLFAHNGKEEVKYTGYASTRNIYGPVARTQQIVSINLLNAEIVPEGAVGVNKEGKWINRYGIVIQKNENN